VQNASNARSLTFSWPDAARGGLDPASGKVITRISYFGKKLHIKNHWSRRGDGGVLPSLRRERGLRLRPCRRLGDDGERQHLDRPARHPFRLFGIGLEEIAALERLGGLVVGRGREVIIFVRPVVRLHAAIGDPAVQRPIGFDGGDEPLDLRAPMSIAHNLDSKENKMSIPTKTARGHPGQWWAIVDGIKYPTVGNKRLTGHHYKQEYSIDGWKSDDLIEDIKDDNQIVLCSEILQDNGIYKRTGYIALFTIKNLQVTRTKTHKTIEFDLVERICHLK
jgi:hypothetical protein